MSWKAMTVESIGPRFIPLCHSLFLGQMTGRWSYGEWMVNLVTSWSFLCMCCFYLCVSWIITIQVCIIWYFNMTELPNCIYIFVIMVPFSVVFNISCLHGNLDHLILSMDITIWCNFLLNATGMPHNSDFLIQIFYLNIACKMVPHGEVSTHNSVTH